MAPAKDPRHPMMRKLMINRVKDHKGRVRIQVSKYWPDGTRFRRYAPNPTVAKKIEARISEAVAMGTWVGLKEEFSRKEDTELTIAEFAPIYINDYCRARNKRTDCKEQVMKSVVEIVGKVKVKEFRRSDAHRYIAIRSSAVQPATINRGIALLKNMLTFALERDLIEMHPLLRFRMLTEEKKALRVMNLEECRRLALSAEDPIIAAYIGVLSETGLRKQEGLQLKWSAIDFRNRILTVEHAKGKRPRYIPLSDYALQWLASLPRVIDSPYVFVRLESHDRWRKPEKQFNQARRKAGLAWVTIHDLRHFRATQWIMRGVDLRTVQELLGHSTITTTMRYAHFAPNHAARRILETQQLEAQELTGEKQAKTEIEGNHEMEAVSVNPPTSMPGTGVEPVRPLRGSGF